MGEIAGDLHRVADSLASSAQITDAVQDVSGNCAAVVTCLGELQATTANLVAEVQTLTGAVQANTAAIQEKGRQRQHNQRHNITRQLRMQAQTNHFLSRIAVALEGRQPSPARSGTPGDEPPPDVPPPHPGSPQAAEEPESCHQAQPPSAQMSGFIFLGLRI